MSCPVQPISWPVTFNAAKGAFRVIFRQVSGHAQEPGPIVVDDGPILKLPPEPQKRLLHDVLGHVRVHPAGVGHGPHFSAVPLVQRFEIAVPLVIRWRSGFHNACFRRSGITRGLSLQTKIGGGTRCQSLLSQVSLQIPVK
jgi:hypothetical protein